MQSLSGSEESITTNAKSLWIRGEHAQATEDFLHRHGWDRTNTEDLDLPGDCAHHLNQIHSGAAQWNSMRTTLITGSGTFSGVGCAGSKELRWKLARLALAITLNENLGAAPVNLFWKDLHDAHANRDDPERERSIEREIVSKERDKQAKAAAPAAAPAATSAMATPAPRSPIESPGSRLQGRKCGTDTTQRREDSPGIISGTSTLISRSSSPGTIIIGSTLHVWISIEILRVSKTNRVSAFQ
jgi:hypothetical protein